MKPTTINKKDLLQQGRDIALPFVLTLADEVAPLVCHTLLRYLPKQRLTMLADFNGQTAVAKIFFAESDQRRDKDGIRIIRQARISTPAILYQGASDTGDIFVNVYEYIEAAKPLSHYVDQHHLISDNLDVFEHTVITIAEMHQKNILQRDLHLDNFLLADNTIYAIDGDEVFLPQWSLSKEDVFENLQLFFAQFTANNDFLIPGFYKLYCDSRAIQRNQADTQALVEGTQKQRQYRKKKYLQKIFRESTPVVYRRSWRQHCLLSRGFEDHLEPLLSNLEGIIANAAENDILKSGRSATLVKAKIDNKTYVIKRYNIKGLGHRLKRAVTKSRAWKSWRNAHLLKFIGVQTPQPVAMFERRWGPFKGTCYYISEYCPGPRLLEYFAETDDKQYDVAENIALIFDSFAKAQISHGDTKHLNFIWSDNTVYVLDLDSLQEYKDKDMAKAALLKDIQRFLANWSDEPAIQELFIEQFNQRNLPL